MATRVLVAAVLGGVIAGLLLAAMQHFAVVPMIVEAERYEVAGRGADAAGHDGGTEAHAGQDHDQAAWAPADGAERTAYTFLTGVITAVGFGLLLSVAYTLRGGVRWPQGVLWGLAGFAAFSLAPALGLPPELPGAPAAPLPGRQLWWVATVVLTAGGLWAIVFAPRALKLVGVAVLVVPHVVGAPQPMEHEGLAPEDLQRSFVFASLITNGVFWGVLGVVTAFFFERFEAAGKSREGLAPGRS